MLPPPNCWSLNCDDYDYYHKYAFHIGRILNICEAKKSLAKMLS